MENVFGLEFSYISTILKNKPFQAIFISQLYYSNDKWKIIDNV